MAPQWSYQRSSIVVLVTKYLVFIFGSGQIWTQVDAIFTNFNCVGWRNVLLSRRKLYAIVKKLLFCSLVCVIIPKQTILKAILWSLASTCVWRSNGEKLAPACEQIWAWSKWSQVNAKYRNYTQVLAKRRRKLPSLLVSLKSFLPVKWSPCDSFWHDGIALPREPKTVLL